MENLLENLNLSVEEDDELIVREEGVECDSVDADLCLVGRFLTDQCMNFALTRSRLATIWKLKRGVMIKEIWEDRFLFHFFHKLDLKQVVDRGSWTIGSHPLIFHHLKVGEIPLQIYDLPICSFSEGVGCSLGNFISKFLEYDSSIRGLVWRMYMHVRVKLDIT
ncbi:hypothetical protein ACS0TY_007670 [Phlomoides rotata]